MAMILGSSADVLVGTPDNDALLGGAGNNDLAGRDGDDRLIGNGLLQFLGLAPNNTLVSFTSANPKQIKSLAITGVNGTLLGIDIRPANGLLYGISTTNQIYTINPKTGAATVVSTLNQPFLATQISGFDFNPVADRLRLVGDNEQNFRINVDTGEVLIDSPLAYDLADPNSGVDPTISGAAYTNAVDNAVTTQLFNIDTAQDSLVLQNPPNNGVLVTVGALGVDFGDLSGFDILSFDNGVNMAYAVSNSTLYQIDVSTGAASRIGQIGDGSLQLQGLTTQIGQGKGGSHTLKGGLGNDKLLGGSENDSLKGNDGNDGLQGDAGEDHLSGGSGVDALQGGKDTDQLSGGSGNDLLDGGDRNDFLTGNTGDDILKGGQGQDSLKGGEDNDLLLGGRDADILDGGNGNDTLVGDGVLGAIALTDTNQLIVVNPSSLTEAQRVQVTGVDGVLLGIDVRPANGLLYGLSTTNILYTIDPTSGVATPVSTLNQPFSGGTLSGFDFNPVADRLRVVGSNEQNFRINVDTGEVTVDTALAYSPTDLNTGSDPAITGAAYTNSFAGTPVTQLYDIDAAKDTLVLQNPPNDGTLSTVGSLGIDVDPLGGFDILSAATGLNTAFALSDSFLYTIDLATGAASSLGQIAGVSDNLVGLTTLITQADNSSPDVLKGGRGDDRLDGGSGKDTLKGNAGADRLIGGTQHDQLVGGNDTDAFVFQSNQPFSNANLGVDTVMDFESGIDRIVLSQTTFGSLDMTSIQIVTSNREAAMSAAPITYSLASGNLYFNSNGTATGFGTGGRFAQLEKAPMLTVSDFQIVA